MIDPQAVDRTGQRQDLRVRGFEDIGEFDADTGQGRHVEEPAIVQSRVALVPVDQRVVLLVECCCIRSHREFVIEVGDDSGAGHAM